MKRIGVCGTHGLRGWRRKGGQRAMKGKWRRPDLLDSDLLTTLRCQLELQYTQREGFERPALSRLGRRARDEMGGCVGLELAMQWSWK